MSLSRIISASLLFAGACIAADSAFVGKWKLNESSSDFGTDVWTMNRAASGEMESVQFAGTYKFRIDGKPYKAALNQTAVWKNIDATTWELVYNPDQKGHEGFGVTTLTLSQAGNRLTAVTKGTMWNGLPEDYTYTYQRSGTGAGLAGRWEAKMPKASTADGLEMSAFGRDGIFVKFSDDTTGCGALLDGKDAPCSGKDYPPKTTLALTAPGPRDLVAVYKYGGTLELKVGLSVSTDGKTLTIRNAFGGGKESILVYDRQ